jgi:hypothetical protein
LQRLVFNGGNHPTDDFTQIHVSSRAQLASGPPARPVVGTPLCLRLRAAALALRGLRLRAAALALRGLRLRAAALALRGLRLRAAVLALRGGLIVGHLAGPPTPSILRNLIDNTDDCRIDRRILAARSHSCRTPLNNQNFFPKTSVNGIDSNDVALFVVSLRIHWLADEQLLSFKPRVFPRCDYRADNPSQKHGYLLGTLSDWKNVFQIRVRSRNDVYADQLTDTPGRSGSCIRGGFHGRYIAANKSGHIARPYFLPTDKSNLCGLYHRIRGFNHRN